MKKLGIMQSVLPRIFRQDNKVELLMQFVNEVQKCYGLAAITVYNVHDSFKRIYSRGISKDHQEYIHNEVFSDEIDSNWSKMLTGVCKGS